MASVLACLAGVVNVALVQVQATPAAEAFRAYQRADPSD
jgi:hypothetical protein